MSAPPESKQGQEPDTDKSASDILLEPFYYLMQNPGKEIRSLLIESFSIWMPDIQPALLATIKSVIGMLHTSSLLIDDIEDDSILRRGNPVAHKIYGIPSTINCANYVYFLALQKLSSFPQSLYPEAVSIFTTELISLHEGQGLELYWRDSSLCPSLQEYNAMVLNKTGLHFQIRDDYMNLFSVQYEENKGYAEDITEGKFSFPIIHYLSGNPESRQQILNILKQRTQDEQIKKYAIRLMKGAGTDKATRAILSGIEADARAEITRLGGNALLEEYLEKLSIQSNA